VHCSKRRSPKLHTKSQSRPLRFFDGCFSGNLEATEMAHSLKRSFIHQQEFSTQIVPSIQSRSHPTKHQAEGPPSGSLPCKLRRENSGAGWPPRAPLGSMQILWHIGWKGSRTSHRQQVQVNVVEVTKIEMTLRNASWLPEFPGRRCVG
jgi:hypothetical protein